MCGGVSSDVANTVITHGISDEKREAVEGLRVRSYPGEITRQSLNDYCVERAETCRSEFDREQKLLQDDSKLSDEQYEALMLSCASLSGAISAYRAVTEFARHQYETGKR